MPDDYVEKAADAARRILELESTKDGWKTATETSDCVVYSRPSTNSKGNIYMSSGNIPASPDKVFNFVYPGVEKPRRTEWDPSVTSAVVIDKPAPELDILVSRTPAVCMGLISAREFVDLVKVTREPTRTWTAAVSVTHVKAGESKGFVRGFNHTSSALCYQIDGNPNETRFVQYVHSDLNGMLPHSLVESAIPSAMAETYSKLKAALEKDAKK